MSSLWLHDAHTTIKSYGATVKGPKAIVRIEVEVSDPAMLGYLLEDLGKVQNALKEAKRPAGKAEKTAIGHREMLAIPDLRGGRS